MDTSTDKLALRAHPSRAASNIAEGITRAVIDGRHPTLIRPATAPWPGVVSNRAMCLRSADRMAIPLSQAVGAISATFCQGQDLDRSHRSDPAQRMGE